MIRVKNLEKALGKFKLKDISLNIPEGYICGLVGRNGAGKTSLIHLILGLYKPDSGYVTIDDLNYEHDEKEIRDIFGVVLNEDILRTGMSIKDLGSMYGAYYSGYNNDQYLCLLDEFKLNKRKDYGSLSRGQKLKTQFALALAINPKYMIMDEPTANFDPEFKDVFISKIREFVSNQKNTVVLSTHMTDDLERNADYLIYLDHGRNIFSGDIEEFREKYRIVHGERYKIKYMLKNQLISLEEKEYSCKALVENRFLDSDYSGLTLTNPTIEEFMYMYSRR